MIIKAMKISFCAAWIVLFWPQLVAAQNVAQEGVARSIVTGNAAAAQVHAATETGRKDAESRANATVKVAGQVVSSEAVWVREAAAGTRETGRLERDLPVLNMTNHRAPAGETRKWSSPPGPEGEDFILFLPRAVLFVPKLVLSLAFWPLSQTLGLLNEYAVVENAIDILYNDERTAGLLPIVNFLSSQGITLGATVFHDDLFGHEESLSASVVYGGRYNQGYEAAFQSDRFLGSRLWVDMILGFDATPQLYFGGIGISTASTTPDPTQKFDARESNILTLYGEERVRSVFGFGYTIGQTGELIKTGLVSKLDVRSFSPAEEGAILSTVDELSIESVYDVSTVPGFQDSVRTLGLFYTLQFDFRDSRGLRQSGPFFEVFAGGNPGVDGWLYGYYGAEFAYTIDLFRQTRSLRFRASLEAVEGDDDEIPFVALPSLGGTDRLRGYVEGQYRDKRAALGSVEYRYPIHNNIEGELFFDAGYVSSNYGDLFALDEWKLGGGGGVLFGSEDSIMFRLEVAYGDAVQVLFASDIAQTLEGFTERP